MISGQRSAIEKLGGRPDREARLAAPFTQRVALNRNSAPCGDRIKIWKTGGRSLRRQICGGSRLAMLRAIFQGQ
jgi:hypothetical protein